MSNGITNEQGLRAAIADADPLNLGGPMNTSTRTLFKRNIISMSREARHPASDLDRWLLRIIVVLLTSALEGCDVNVLADATGYPGSFIEHVWGRAKQTGVELNPLKWVYDGSLSGTVWDDAFVIEGKARLERYADGKIGLIEIDNFDDFFPDDFVAAFRNATGIKTCARAFGRSKDGQKHGSG